MDEREFECYMKAGEIAAKVRRYVEQSVKPGEKLIDIANRVEDFIRSLGAEPAFPLNISINDVAAHYTPLPNDPSVLPPNSVVKIDIGVHVEGYIADTAVTLCFNDKYVTLVEATREALERAIQRVAPGIRFSEIGKIVEEVLRSYGYRPIYNLSGHSLGRYLIHAGETIPNFRDVRIFGRFRDGNAYAIEPFATNGCGFVIEGSTVPIYALKPNPKKVRDLGSEARKVFETVYNHRRTLPFALRWYLTKFDLDTLVKALNEMKRLGLVVEYPILVERSGGVVAQFEHTVVIYRGKVYVTTVGGG